MAVDINELNAFIVRAKAATYVGDGEHVSSCRVGSHDLRFTEDRWAYLDSYFGGTDSSVRKLFISMKNPYGR